MYLSGDTCSNRFQIYLANAGGRYFVSIRLLYLWRKTEGGAHEAVNRRGILLFSLKRAVHFRRSPPERNGQEA